MLIIENFTNLFAMSSTLVVVSQIEEQEALLSAFRHRGYRLKSIQTGILKGTAITSLDMIVAVGGHGKAQFALQAQHLIENLSGVERLFCVGGAGSLVDTLEFGDIVVGTTTVEYDYKLRFVSEPLPGYAPDVNLLEEFQEIPGQGNAAFNIHLGPVASGDEDVVDAKRRREIRILTDALCVAWEGSGGARAAQFNGLPFLEIRGITDNADSNAGSSFHQNLARVIPNISDLLIRWHRSKNGSHD